MQDVCALLKSEMTDKGYEKSRFFLTFPFSINTVQKAVSVDTRGRFNVFETASCVYWSIFQVQYDFFCVYIITVVEKKKILLLRKKIKIIRK